MTAIAPAAQATVPTKPAHSAKLATAPAAPTAKAGKPAAAAPKSEKPADLRLVRVLVDHNPKKEGSKATTVRAV